MKDKIKGKIKKSAMWGMIEPLRRTYVNKKYYRYYSYSQRGEDLIVVSLLGDRIKDLKKKLAYLDIGANDPVKLSNTYLLHSKYGLRGGLVEANPTLITQLKRERKGDIVLNVGLSDKNGSLPFYIMESDVLSTFDYKAAQEMERMGASRIRSKIDVPVVTFTEVVKKHFNSKCPYIVSIDTEGHEMTILNSIDFDRYRPYIMIVETMNFESGEKEDEIINFLLSKNYCVAADTSINSIFVDTSI